MSTNPKEASFFADELTQQALEFARSLLKGTADATVAPLAQQEAALANMQSRLKAAEAAREQTVRRLDADLARRREAIAALEAALDRAKAASTAAASTPERRARATKHSSSKGKGSGEA